MIVMVEGSLEISTSSSDDKGKWMNVEDHVIHMLLDVLSYITVYIDITWKYA